MSFNFSDGTTQSSATGILEKIWVPCDGRTVSTKSGNNMSITNVTGEQNFDGKLDRKFYSKIGANSWRNPDAKRRN